MNLSDPSPVIAMFLLVALIALPFRVMVAYCATVRGRSACVWSFLTYVLGPFALMVLVLPPDERSLPVARPFWHALGCEVLCTLLGLPVLGILLSMLLMVKLF